MDPLNKRPRLTVVSVEEIPLAARLLEFSPLKVEVEGEHLLNLPAPPGLKGQKLKTWVETPHTCRIISDNEGDRHYFWRRGEAVDSPVWFLSHRAGGRRRVCNDGVEITCFTPGGVFHPERLSYDAGMKLQVGDCFGTEYPFQQVGRHIGSKFLQVLACGGARSFCLPLWYIPPSQTNRDPWPDYVRKLLRHFNSPEKWESLLATVRNKYSHGLFSREGPILRALKSAQRGKDHGPNRARSSPAYCFNSSQLDTLLTGSEHLEFRSGIAWGEKGDLAWVYKVGGKIAVILVDSPIAEKAAWVFADETSAAQLLNIHPEHAQRREMRAALKRRALYYCPHQGAWQERLTLLLLKILEAKGNQEAAETISVNFRSKPELHKQVDAILEAFRIKTA